MPTPVLFLHSSAGRYGADLQLLSIAGGLDHTRFIPICVLPERGRLAPLLEEAGAEVLARPLAVLRRGLSARAAIATAGALGRDRRELGALAKERGVQLVHSNTSVVLSGQAVASAAGARHLLHVREIYAGAGGTLGAALWPIMRRRLLQADALACISAAVARQFGGAARAVVLRDGLVRVPEGAPRDTARERLGVPADAFAVALIGRVSDWKGQDVLARALAEPALAEVGAVGLVAGDAFPGRERFAADLAAMRTELGLGPRLRLLGFYEDLGTLLGAADAVAVPSTRPEPLGLVALEAAAAGLPVVAADHGGLPEVVSDGETGVLVPPGDHRVLAAALRGLADDPGRARRLGEAGARVARERFGRERMLAEIEALYGRLLG